MAGALVLSVALDLARPYLGPPLRPWQYAAGMAVLAALWSVLRHRGMRPRQLWPWFALLAFLLPTYVDHTRRVEPGDPVHYYTYLRSVLFDLDLDLANDYPILGWHLNAAGISPIGAPILWSPLVLLVHVLREGARAFGLGPPTGAEPLYQATVCLATVLYGIVGLLLLFDTLRRFTSGAAAAFWATVLVWVGSPLRFYLSVIPAMPHGVEFLAAVLVLRSYLDFREHPDLRRAALAGAACGLVFLIRSQDGLLLALPLAEASWRLLRGPDRGAPLRAAFAMAGAFLLVALPQLGVWQAMHGTAFVVPHERLHGDHFFLDDPLLGDALVSPRGGLFTSHPVLLIALAGLVALAFRDPRYVLSVFPVLIAAWYLNASVFDWYHVRRYTGLVPLMAPGLAVLIAPLTRAGVLVPALLAFLVLRYDLAVDGLRALPGQPAPVAGVLAEVSDGLAADAYRLLEPRAPRWAVRGLAAYTGEALLDDDEPMSLIDLGGTSWVLKLPYKARKLSGVSVEDGVLCRWVTDRDARLYLPLAWEGGVIVTLRARALETAEPQALEVLWNESAVGASDMTPAWRDYRFRVPQDLVHAGTNVLALVFARGPIYHRARGEGPREVRPAALATITLHRDTEAP